MKTERIDIRRTGTEIQSQVDASAAAFLNEGALLVLEDEIQDAWAEHNIKHFAAMASAYKLLFPRQYSKHEIRKRIQDTELWREGKEVIKGIGRWDIPRRSHEFKHELRFLRSLHALDPSHFENVFARGADWDICINKIKIHLQSTLSDKKAFDFEDVIAVLYTLKILASQESLDEAIAESEVLAEGNDVAKNNIRHELQSIRGTGRYYNNAVKHKYLEILLFVKECLPKFYARHIHSSEDFQEWSKNIPQFMETIRHDSQWRPHDTLEIAGILQGLLFEKKSRTSNEDLPAVRNY